MLGRFNPLAIMCGNVVTVVVRVLLGFVSAMLLPDTTYQENHALAVTVHYSNLALGCAGGFVSGYATAWLAGEWKILHAGIVTLPFVLLAASAPVTPGAPEFAHLERAALPAIATLLGAWIEDRFPLQH